MTGPADAGLRLDKWLWFARFCKSRSLAARLCESAGMRLNKVIVRKAHQAVRVGDVLTFPQGLHIRVVAIKALGQRRGPAPEAALLYEDLAPPPGRTSPREPDRPDAAAAGRAPGAGRPTKAERRAIDRLRASE
ncbi:MAG: RNA-binding S4 domain-containing protein [Alphaproteobacteria bacterium]|nr:RNA-binding S4 domain-containing protein [Alphaproteobacteria bacterium]